MIDSFSKIAIYLSDPLIMASFIIFLAYCGFRLILKMHLIPQVKKSDGSRLLNLFVHYGFLICILIILLAFSYKHSELQISEKISSNASTKIGNVNIARSISIQTVKFSTQYDTFNPLSNTQQTVKVDIEYPQITGHPEKTIERKVNDLLANWAGINNDHQSNGFDHATSFEIVSRESNILAISLEDSGLFVGAATSATINKTIVLNLVNGEAFQLKDIFRAGYNNKLHEMVRQRAFCDIEKTRRADDPGPIKDDQEFLIKNGNLVLVYQRREICAGADGPTFVTIESTALKPLINPNGPLGYII